MKKVSIKQMTLVNFKGIKSLTVPFGPVTEIRGANATGKSTIADAFNWVLFGKDAAGNSDTKFGIKTCDETGNTIPKLDHEVTAILDVDGQTVELRRVLSEDWVTPRGSATPVMKGNSTSCFYNGVPLKESEYKARISAIIEEDLFRMLTNPLYFPRLDWQTQREMLLKIAGGVSIEDIASGRREMEEILSRISGKSLAEYKAEISARKKKIKEALDLIPARIDEVTRATPPTPDFAALEIKKTAKEKELSDVEKAISDKLEAQKQQHEAVMETQRQINALTAKQQQVVFEARQAENKRVSEANADIVNAQNDYHHISQSRKNQEERHESFRKNSLSGIEANSRKVADIEKQLEEKRAEWAKVNAEEFDETKSVCPTCNQTLPEDKINELIETFSKNKEARLAAINSEGIKLKNWCEDIKQRNVSLQTDLNNSQSDYEKNIVALDAQLTNIQSRLNGKEQSKAREIDGKDLPEWVELENQIQFLKESIPEAEAPDKSEWKARKQTLAAQLDEIKNQLNLRAVIESNNARKAKLLKEEKDLAQQKADLERLEFACDSLVKEQMNEVERRVNGKFSLVRFKMFSSQINGGEKPDCILTSKATGAKFQDTNNADKINIGLDIINTLCEFNGVSAPLFIDNSESVNEFIPVKSQLIKLTVTTDKQLIIK